MNGNQVLVAVMLWLSGVVVDQVFILGGLDVRVKTYLLIIAGKGLYSHVKFSRLVSIAKLFEQRNFPDLYGMFALCLIFQ